MGKHKAICVNPGGTTNLKKGETFYVNSEAINEKSFYVYRFPHVKGFCGCYQASYFEIGEAVTEEEMKFAEEKAKEKKNKPAAKKKRDKSKESDIELNNFDLNSGPVAFESTEYGDQILLFKL